MLFKYKAIDQHNASREGTVEASNIDAAISTVQKRGYTVLSIDPIDDKTALYNLEINLFQGIKVKEIVIMSRQLATLFEAQVSALRVFRLLATEADKPQLAKVLNSIADDLQAGSSISRALSNHPDVFSSFYVNMVRSGEETGSLEKSFNYLADYMDRSYEITTKARTSIPFRLASLYARSSSFTFNAQPFSSSK